MCGISVLVAVRDGSKTVDGDDVAKQAARARLLDKMELSLNMIKHRGPDSTGIWISDDEQVVLGHNRLAINDLSDGGNQPLHSPDGTVHAVVNGELYDYDQMRARLSSEFGYQFTSNSDSEIVLGLYKAFGLDFVQHLRGEFALCLYDDTKRLFIAARDRYGIKPLFYTQNNRSLLVAAEVKAFVPLGWQPEWDVTSIVEAGWNFDDRTLFKGVKKLNPGHYMTCDAAGNLEFKQYWDIDYPNKRVRDDRTELEIIEGVRERLVEAIAVRLRADVPVGVYLSGGIDSSVIAGVVTHLTKKQGHALGSIPAEERVQCFCVAFDKTSGYDESDVAERTAAWLGVKIHKQVMDEEAFAARFEDATWHCEHHNADLNYIGKFALSEVPRKLGYKVVLTGEGSDEIFTGYGIYLPDVLREPDLSWKGAMPEDGRISLFDKSESATSAYYRSEGARDLNREQSNGRQKLNGISTASAMSAFMPDLFEEWTSLLNPRNPEDVIADNVPKPVLQKMQQLWHPANTAQYVWTKGHLVNIFMSCLGDRTEMAHSIEGRTPFLDHHLTEYVNKIPQSLKMKWNGGTVAQSKFDQPENKRQQNDQFTAKWVLREAMKPFITEELYERVKHPFSAPLKYKVGGPMHSLLKRLITEENVLQLGFVSWDKASTLLRRAFEDKEAAAARLAFCVAQWIVLAQRFGIRTAKQPAD